MARLRSWFTRPLILQVLVFALLGVGVLVVPMPAPQNPTTRHLTLGATQFEFVPGRIEVNQGDTIMIDMMASDVVHGFHLDGYGIDERLEPGITTHVTFVAVQVGKFRFRCSVSCGSLHPFMIGELVVGPNAPFWRMVGVVLVALLGILVYLYQFNISSGAINEHTQERL
jgi:heme/copper-type cytochrome/quinol oxidase subunit 2